MKFSVAVTSVRGFKNIEPLFKTSSPDAEIIIVDPNYNEQTKEKLEQLNHDYCKVTYAPKWDFETKIDVYSTFKYLNDKNRCRNNAIAYCEGDWIYRLDDSTEFCPDFFKKLDETITLFKEQFNNTNFVIRPVKLESWMGHKKWADLPSIANNEGRFFELDRNSYFETLDQFIATRKSLNLLNGMDEQYDVGHGDDDRDILQRFISLGYRIFLDKELKTFQIGHKRNLDPIPFTKWLYDVKKLEIINGGKYCAYNPYEITELRNQLLKEKDKYTLDKNKPTVMVSGTISSPQILYNNDVTKIAQNIGIGKAVDELESRVLYNERGVVASGVYTVLTPGKDIFIGSSGQVNPFWEKYKDNEKKIYIENGSPVVSSGVYLKEGIELHNTKKTGPNHFIGDYPLKQFFLNFLNNNWNEEKIDLLKNMYKDQDVFLLGNSRSVTKGFLDDIRYKTSFAANGFIACRDHWDFEPTYFVVTDPGVLDPHMTNINPDFTIDGEALDGKSEYDLLIKAKTAKFVLSDLIIKPFLFGNFSRKDERLEWLEKNIHVKGLNKDELSSPFMISPKQPVIDDISFDLQKGTFMYGTIITDLMIPLAVWMGFKNIYLKGCSGGPGKFFTNDTDDKHFWKSDYQKRIYQDIYALFKQKLDEVGVNIYNLDSPHDIEVEGQWTLGKGNYVIPYVDEEKIL